MYDFIVDDLWKVEGIVREWGILLLTAALVYFTRSHVRESKESRRAAIKPCIKVELQLYRGAVSHFFTIINNVGKGVALNVEVSLEGDEEDFKAHRMSSVMETASPIESILPGAGGIKTYILGNVGDFYPTSGQPPLKLFVVKTKYQDIDGNSYEGTDQIDVSRLIELESSIVGPEAWQQAAAVERIANCLHDISKLLRERSN